MVENRRMTGLQRGFLVCMIIFIVLCIFIPVWQSGVNDGLKRDISLTTEQIANLKNQEKKIESEIAKIQSPEFLIQQSKIKQIAFSQVYPESVTLMGGI